MGIIAGSFSGYALLLIIIICVLAKNIATKRLMEILPPPNKATELKEINKRRNQYNAVT